MRKIEVLNELTALRSILSRSSCACWIWAFAREKTPSAYEATPSRLTRGRISMKSDSAKGSYVA